MIDRASKEGMHPRNRFRGGYDFRELMKRSPPLSAFVRPNAFGDLSIDYANPSAVIALNQALLRDAYGLHVWDVPRGYLCPPIPGRSDYVHHVADLLAGDGVIPRGPETVVLDIGVGASCIYPLIGAREYGWRFVGTDTDPLALRAARRLVSSNPEVASLIECRAQESAIASFKGVVREGETFAASMCNPPFHATAAEAEAASSRKRRNLGRAEKGSPALNFGGRASELWCRGGELGFVRRMIEQSVDCRDRFLWFTTLVSKSANLPVLQKTLRAANAAEIRTIEMAQGQKRSRILAWTLVPKGSVRASVKRAR